VAFRIIRNDITKVAADVIVNSANPRPICGGSTEAHIYDVAGYDDLLEARQKIGHLEIGQLGVTSAFNLPAKKVIHISCPWWNESNPDDSIRMLSSCYISVIDKAKELGAKSIAFPLLSSGVYRFPKALALDIATTAFELYNQDDIEIILVVYDAEAFDAAKQYSPVDMLAQDVAKSAPRRAPRRNSLNRNCPSRPAAPAAISDYAVVKEPAISGNPYEQEMKEINRIISACEATFHDFFIEKVTQFKCGSTDSKKRNAEIYQAANIDRKLFSKVYSKDNYTPKKYTVIALGIGLRLDLENMEQMLEAAGCSFNSSKRDLVIKYFLRQRDFYKKHGRFAIHVINDVLQIYHEDILGQND